jgi:hypothetical protein
MVLIGADESAPFQNSGIGRVFPQPLETHRTADLEIGSTAGFGAGLSPAGLETRRDNRSGERRHDVSNRPLSPFVPLP